MRTADGAKAGSSPLAGGSSATAAVRPGLGNELHSLRALFAANRGRILLTYILFNGENLLRLAQPFVLGLAINDLLQGRTTGLLLFVVQHLAHLVVGSFRQMYDTRTFTGIYADLASRLVESQRASQVEVSRIAARSSLSREYVDFFERSVPIMIRGLYSVAGALVMVSFYDVGLIPICLGLLLPAIVANRIYGRYTLRLSKQLHDELENEVAVVERAQPEEIRRHYAATTGWRVRLSDAEALNFGAMELFVLAALVGALFRVASLPGIEPGDIFAIFRYLMMFLMGLDSVPQIVQQASRIRDIRNRLRCPAK